MQADKSQVQLKLGEESSAEVTIASKLPGAVTLRLEYPKTNGLEISLDRPELKSGEQAKIHLRFQPPEKASAKAFELRVVVDPTNQMIPIAVSIQ